MNVVNGTVAAVDQLLPVIDSRYVHKDVYQVKVTCSQIGETHVEYRVGNVATSTNTNPVEALTSISVSIRIHHQIIINFQSKKSNLSHWC